MKSRILLSALVLLGAVVAHAQAGTWELDAHYNYVFNTSVTGDTSSFGDIELAMTEHGIDGSYSAETKTGGYSVGYPTGNAFNFYQTRDAKPVLDDSFIMGVLTDAQQTQHLVLFTNTAAAANISGTPYDGVFATSAQPYQYTEDQVIGALTDLHGGGTPAHQSQDYTVIYNFEDAVARNANVGTNGTKGDAWFKAGQNFSIVEFSNGLTVGSGTSDSSATFTPDPAPEPAPILALAGGAWALLRRRKRALR